LIATYFSCSLAFRLLLTVLLNTCKKMTRKLGLPQLASLLHLEIFLEWNHSPLKFTELHFTLIRFQNISSVTSVTAELSTGLRHALYPIVELVAESRIASLTLPPC
jgi:hypothetical protein